MPEVLFVSMDRSESVERPDGEDDFPYDLFVRHAADGGVPGIDGNGPVVPHHEDPGIRYLVRQLDVAFAEGFFCLEIGFVDDFVIDIDVAFLVDVDPVARIGDDSLYQDFVVIVKGDDVACFGVALFHGEHDVAFREERVHGGSVDVEYRQEEHRNQDRHGCHGDQGEDGASQGHPEALLFVLSPQL